MRDDLDYRAWVERGRAVTVETAANFAHFKPLRGYERANERMGPCPACGRDDTFAINVKKNKWVCRAGHEGGRDGIGLVMHCFGLPFPDAVEKLIGPPPDDRAADAAERRARQSAAEAALRRLQADNARDAAQRDRDNNFYRQKERRWAYNAWNAGQRLARSPALDYFAARGVLLPADIRLRWHPDWPLYDRDATGKAALVHKGPAFFAPILRPDGYFDGLHATWFDPDRPGEKIYVTNSEGARVPAKKVRGLKKGNHIPLTRGYGKTRLFLGEGIETVLSPYTALTRRGSSLLENAGWWTSVDLGNLAGKALDRMPHPTEMFDDKAGRRRRRVISGTVPDPDDLALTIPDSITDLYLIGDGDSETVRTHNALQRAARRHARTGRRVFIVFSKDGFDFNDMLRGRDRVA